MPLPPNRNWSSSRGSSPSIAFEVRPSLRAQVAVLVFVAVAAAASWLADNPAVLVSLALGWNPVRTIVFGRGRRAVRFVEWRADGRWWIGSEVRLHPATSTLGPWILLVWRNPAWRRSYVLVDANCIGQATFRTLKGRLRIEAGRVRRRARDHNW
jgi:hypothetical protein